MRKYSFILVLFASDLMGAVKIGYIDSQRIFQEYKGRARLEAEWNKKLQEWQQKAAEMRKKIEEKYREIESQRLLLSEEALKEREKELEELQKEYQEFIQRIWGPGGEAEKQNKLIMQPLVEKVSEILKRIAEEEGYTIILDVAGMGVVYAKPELDLTDRVIEELNSEYEKKGVAKPEKRTKILVLEFKELNEEAKEENYSEKIPVYLSTALVSSGFAIPEKEDISRERENLSLTKPGYEFTEDELLNLGRRLEVEYIITGEVSKENQLVKIKCKIFSLKEKKFVKEIEEEKEIEYDIQLWRDAIQELAVKIRDAISH